MFKTSAGPGQPAVGRPAAHGEVARHGKPLNGRGGVPSQYPYRLSFYDRPPFEEITIEQFEEWALDRLRGGLQRCRHVFS